MDLDSEADMSENGTGDKPGEGGASTDSDSPGEASREALTTGEAAGICGVHAETIRRAIRKGDLQAAKLGGEWRISRADLEEWYQSKGGGRLWSD